MGELKIFNHPCHSQAQREATQGSAEANRYRVYTRKHFDKIPQLQHLPATDRTAMKAVSAVLPFRGNNYVVNVSFLYPDPRAVCHMSCSSLCFVSLTMPLQYAPKFTTICLNLQRSICWKSGQKPPWLLGWLG